MTDANIMRAFENEPEKTAVVSNPDSITVLVNKEFGLPSSYVPGDLEVPDIPFSFSGYHEKKLMRREAAQALEHMFRDAAREGLSLHGVSGYRSYERQQAIYDSNVNRSGRERTDMYSARPGHSEHQTGLAMDISTQSIHNRLDQTFAATPEGRWLADHGYEYGFIIRYPKDKTDITGYAYEPWHVRYVGRELAKELHDSNLTLEEYYENKPGSPAQQISYDASIESEAADSAEQLL